MTWNEMKVFLKDQIGNYTVDGRVDRTRLARDARKNFGLSAQEAKKLVEELNVDSRSPRA